MGGAAQLGETSHPVPSLYCGARRPCRLSPWPQKRARPNPLLTGGHSDEDRRAGPEGGALGVGGPSSPLAPSSVVDAVQLDAATDPELPQPLQDLLTQTGGPQALPIECQLQPSLLAQEQHLGKEDMSPAGILMDPLLPTPCPDQ